MPQLTRRCLLREPFRNAPLLHGKRFATEPGDDTRCHCGAVAATTNRGYRHILRNLMEMAHQVADMNVL